MIVAGTSLAAGDAALHFDSIVQRPGRRGQRQADAERADRPEGRPGALRRQRTGDHVRPTARRFRRAPQPSRLTRSAGRSSRTSCWIIDPRRRGIPTRSLPHLGANGWIRKRCALPRTAARQSRARAGAAPVVRRAHLGSAFPVGAHPGAPRWAARPACRSANSLAFNAFMAQPSACGRSFHCFMGNSSFRGLTRWIHGAIMRRLTADCRTGALLP